MSVADHESDECLQLPKFKRLPEFITANLCAKQYDKRKSAAMGIQTVVARYIENDDYEGVNAVISDLTSGFVESTQSFNRKGGLIGLAAVAIAIRSQKLSVFLKAIIAPVLMSLNDYEYRVRYYACESLVNIVKTARTAALVYLNPIYAGLCILYSDPDTSVRNGGSVLNRTMKDIIASSDLDNSIVERFLPVLQERLYVMNPSIRLLNTSWILMLDSLPGISMLIYLDLFLERLLRMLSDSIRDVRQRADATLQHFLALSVSYLEFESPESIGDTSDDWFSHCVRILYECSCSDNASLARLTALSWLSRFVALNLTCANFFTLFPNTLDVVFRNLDDSDNLVCKTAMTLNTSLEGIVRDLPYSPVQMRYLNIIYYHIEEYSGPNGQIASTSWLRMLLAKCSYNDSLEFRKCVPALIRMLEDMEENQLFPILQILMEIASIDDDCFNYVFTTLLSHFKANQQLLRERCSHYVRIMSTIIPPERVIKAFAFQLSIDHLETVDSQALEFANCFVRVLHCILLTSYEFEPIRESISDELFHCLYDCWVHEPISAITLCLVARWDQLASELVSRLSHIEITVGLMTEVCALVKYFRSPVFLDLRLRLLDPHKHLYLLKTLYGLMMVLPQNPSFHSLQKLLSHGESIVRLGKKTTPRYKERSTMSFSEVKAMIGIFDKTQAAHTKLRSEQLAGASFWRNRKQ